ncbi:MAG: hypothetical protein ACI9FB_003761 [Candidatus Azotimanducaceae bacterium]|jgi:uncharacterized protein (TIGR00299 family) protein
MHLHFDLVGGISGDMFIAAMLDVFPHLIKDIEKQIELAGFPKLVGLETKDFSDGVLCGKSFKVKAKSDAEGHSHRHHSEIKEIISSSQLDAKTKIISLQIFEIIAIAEAKIHNKSVDTVAFHEVGAWDSIADVICASYLISQCELNTISHSTLPLGGGRVKSAHGLLPLPAPATTLILEGFTFHDDGISGERITPTGAAILKFLSDNYKNVNLDGVLQTQGFGFGTKKMLGISNVLRILQFETAETEISNITCLEFEIDDQSSEELSIGLEKIRAMPGTLDVIQYAVAGKKNRLATAIRILVKSLNEQDITQACFRFTTTLGIRSTVSRRFELPREISTVQVENKTYQIKSALRPGGKTIKADIDYLADAKSYAELREIKSQIESTEIKEEDQT